MQLSLFDIYTDEHILLLDLFRAYFEARRNKRYTLNALDFERYFETNIFNLRDDICSGIYYPKSSICFVVDKPVKREIFAAHFRDRIVHHYIIGKLNPIFEKEFIYDSYACRKNKGTHFGIKRINDFIRKCSKNYKDDCYILKLDIKGFFMHINRNILYNKLHKFISDKYIEHDKDLLINLCHIVIFNDPTINCVIKGFKTNWNDLPTDKSLFHSPLNCGLPIGNLTSQVFANFYLNSFDKFIINDLKIRYYGRYVDDFVIIHKDKGYLISLIPLIRKYLEGELLLTLHPKKIYLQHFSKGVKFLGTIIKPYRIYIANRTKGNFFHKIEKWNKVIETEKILNTEQQGKFMSCINSYLGIMRHFKTYKIRRNMLNKKVSKSFWNVFSIQKDYLKIRKAIKKSYRRKAVNY